MNYTSGKGKSSRRGHTYRTDSSEDESDQAMKTNMNILQDKRARSIRAILMDAAARGLLDHSDFLKDVYNDPPKHAFVGYPSRTI